MSKLKSFHTLLFCLLLLGFALVFTGAATFGSYKSQGHWLQAKRAEAIRCGSGKNSNEGYSQEQIKEKPSDTQAGSGNHSPPSGNDNNSGCSHQQGASALCSETGSRRRITRNTTC